MRAAFRGRFAIASTLSWKCPRLDRVCGAPVHNDGDPSSDYPFTGRRGSRRQRARFGEASQRLNRQMEGGEMAEHCRLDARTTHVLEAAIQKFCV